MVTSATAGAAQTNHPMVAPLRRESTPAISVTAANGTTSAAGRRARKTTRPRLGAFPDAEGLADAGSGLLTRRWYAEPAAGSLCDGGAMPVLALSVVDVLVGIGLAAAGFLVVALVCAAVLAMLQVVLPSVDAGAAEIDRLHPPDSELGAEVGDAAPIDSEVDA